MKLIGCSQDISQSKLAQIRMGLKHFLFFINYNLHEQESWWDVLGKELIVEPDSIPTEFFTNTNLDKFGQYMADYARHHVGDEESGNAMLSVQTLENYYGAVNTYYSTHHPVYKDLPTMPPFEASKWTRL